MEGFVWGGLLWLSVGQLPGEAELDSLDPTGAKEKSAWSPGDRRKGQRRDSVHVVVGGGVSTQN